MSRLQERRQLRRDYLKKKLLTLGATGASGVVFLYCLSATVLLLCLCGFTFRSWLHQYGDKWLFVCLMSLGIAIVTGILTVMAGFLTRYTLRKAARVPYVPRVTHDALAPEEVLMRGSQQPTAVQRESLLRAAAAGETPQAQLLRSSAKHAEEQKLIL